MIDAISVQRIGPAVTVQDAGWSGALASGLSRGGVADTYALAQIYAVLGQEGTAVLEMAGTGGRFAFLAAGRIAFAGANMDLRLDGAPLRGEAVHQIEAGQILDVGAARGGIYGYLGIGGGFVTPRFLGSASTHRGAGLGQVIEVGQTLVRGDDPKPDRVGLTLPPRTVQSTPIRVVPTAHTDLFPRALCDAFEQEVFTRGAKGNRQGVALETDKSFALTGGQSIPSETVIPGDIQVPGQGAPFALLADSQTTGGYPRIASILPCDLPRVAQANIGDALRFKFISRQEGIALERAERKTRAALSSKCTPILRDPAQMGDLLSYQLISGAISGETE